MFKKVFSITIIAMLLFNVNTFADTNILSNQQQKVSKVMFERDLKKIIEFFNVLKMLELSKLNIFELTFSIRELISVSSK